MSLLQQIESRKQREHNEEELIFQIQEAKRELWVARHILKCEMCQSVTVLGVERYLGSRCPWYLNLINDVGTLDEQFPECPRVEDYEIGNYWDRTEGKALPFVLARTKWAEKILKQNYIEMVQELRQIRRERQPEIPCFLILFGDQQKRNAGFSLEGYIKHGTTP